MVECRDVQKIYHSGRGQVAALRSISFTVEPGALAAIVGKSGSGKTTLLNCLGGLDRPDSGSILCCGRDVLALSPRDLSIFLRHEVGFVFQFGNLLSYLTVQENIAFPLQLNAMTGAEQSRRVAGLLERIGLADAGRALPGELSGGEVQRVAIARALAPKPRLLLADEPTASLDSATGTSLMQLMFAMGRETGCTMVMATHDVEVMSFADQCISIRDGMVHSG